MTLLPPQLKTPLKAALPLALMFGSAALAQDAKHSVDAGGLCNGAAYDPRTRLFLWWSNPRPKRPEYHDDELCFYRLGRRTLDAGGLHHRLW